MPAPRLSANALIWSPPVVEELKPYQLPTLEDCQTKNVHYFKTGLSGVKPDCGHKTYYKECKNCGKVVWTGCARCQEEASAARSLAGRMERKGIVIEPPAKKRNQNQK